MNFRLPEPRGERPFASDPPRRARAGNRPRRNAKLFVWFVLVGGLLSAAALALYGVLHGGYGGDPHAPWKQAEAELRAAGEPLAFADVVPPDVPAEQNFFEAEVFAGLAQGKPENALLVRAMEPARGLAVGELLATATRGGGASLEAIGNAMLEAGLVRRQTEFLLAGDRVRAGVRGLGLDFAPLVAAADRPAARFPVDYSQPFPPLPHLAPVEALANWLAIRAMAGLSVGDNDGAAIDLLLIGRLADALATEPFPASQGARRRLLGLFAGCVRVGIGWNAWTGDQLAQFAETFARERVLADLALAIRGERAQLNAAIDQAITARKPVAAPALAAWLGPDLASLDVRTLRARQAAINRALQTFLTALETPGALSPAGLATPADPALPEATRTRLAALADDARLAAQIQTYLAQAETACALERYRLGRGEYPEKLAALTPEVIAALPADPMTAAPLGYARPKAAAFTLTGAGWSEGGPWVWTRE